MRGRDGESLSPRDLLDDDELRRYHEERRLHYPTHRPHHSRRWHDEYGYDELGRWDPSRDGIDPEEWR